MKRREFLNHAGLILGSGAVLSGCREDRGERPPAVGLSNGAGSGAPLLESLGVQLYTLRTLMREDVRGTLRTVSDLGYQEVEFAGLFGHDPTIVREWLDESGLSSPAAHVPLEALTDELEQSLSVASALGLRWLVLPWLSVESRTLDGYRATARLLNDVGLRAADVGVGVAYHNHEFEFADLGGTSGLDILLEETDPDLVDFEVDFYWLAEGGGHASALFDAHPGRFTLCHAKDRTRSGEMVAVGAGDLDWSSLFAMADQAGLRHTFVEHDEPDDPITSIKESLDYLLGA